MRTKTIDPEIYKDLQFCEELILQVLDYLTEDEHNNNMFNPVNNLITVLKKLPINNSLECNKYN